MLVRANIVYAIGAAAVVAAAVLVARRMSESEGPVGPLAVFVAFTSWALCVWFTPLGPHLWQASALGLVAVAGFLAVAFAAVRGIPLFVERPDAPVPPGVRRRFFAGCAWLVVLMFALPVIGHLAALGLPALHDR